MRNGKYIEEEIEREVHPESGDLSLVIHSTATDVSITECGVGERACSRTMVKIENVLRRLASAADANEFGRRDVMYAVSRRGRRAQKITKSENYGPRKLLPANRKYLSEFRVFVARNVAHCAVLLDIVAVWLRVC